MSFFDRLSRRPRPPGHAGRGTDSGRAARQPARPGASSHIRAPADARETDLMTHHMIFRSWSSGGLRATPPTRCPPGCAPRRSAWPPAQRSASPPGRPAYSRRAAPTRRRPRRRADMSLAAVASAAARASAARGGSRALRGSRRRRTARSLVAHARRHVARRARILSRHRRTVGRTTTELAQKEEASCTLCVLPSFLPPLDARTSQPLSTIRPINPHQLGCSRGTARRF